MVNLREHNAYLTEINCKPIKHVTDLINYARDI